MFLSLTKQIQQNTFNNMCNRPNRSFTFFFIIILRFTHILVNKNITVTSLVNHCDHALFPNGKKVLKDLALLALRMLQQKTKNYNSDTCVVSL